MNRDTLYSAGVFDLTEPVTVTQPDTDDRYQLLIVINQDNYLRGLSTTAGDYTLTQDEVGTRYCLVLVRTLFDPNDPDDIETVHAIQDEITASQRSPGTFEISNWDQQSLEQIREALITVGETMDDSRGVGRRRRDRPRQAFSRHRDRLGRKSGNGRVRSLANARTERRRNAIYAHRRRRPRRRVLVRHRLQQQLVSRGKRSTLAAKYDAYAINNVTAERYDDGSVSVHFGGDPDQPNFLYTPERWNYKVRLYGPSEEILDGSYQFPEAEPIE
jgi:hypothetical protein